MSKNRCTYTVIGTCLILIIACVIISCIGVKNAGEKGEMETSKVTDECTEEWEEYRNSFNTIEVNSNEKVVQPETKIIFKNYYKSCGHIETIEETASDKIVNMNEKELEKEYSDYEIKDFAKKEINLYKEIDGLCDKHYLLIEEEAYVSVYKLQNNGDRVLVAKTNISSEYLTDVDNVQLKQGIHVYGVEELNRALEDFE